LSWIRFSVILSQPAAQTWVRVIGILTIFPQIPTWVGRLCTRLYRTVNWQ
jgi:hypothetical protein